MFSGARNTDSRRAASPKLRAGGTEAMAKPNPFDFLQQVRSEASKVTWPTRKETMVTTVMVLVMIVVASLFFMFTDWTIRLFLSFVLGVGR
jgi:preprotein translocase subunit SecE